MDGTTLANVFFIPSRAEFEQYFSRLTDEAMRPLLLLGSP